MRNKKGFTLIELLAVIVILAIIALIATPIILGIIEDAKKGSAESSANGYIDAVEFYTARLELKNEILESGTYDVKDLEIDLDGEKPTYGEVTIEKGSVIAADICIGGYNVVYENGKIEAKDACSKNEKVAFSPKVGDYVKMTPTATSFETEPEKTGYTDAQTINPSELNLWRVIRVNSDGTIEMVSEYVSSTSVYFEGQTGYKNFVGYLNEIAKQYENSKYTIDSRHMGYNGQTEYLTDTANTVDSTEATAPWTESTGASTVESEGGGDTLYETDTELVTEAIGTLKSTTASGSAASYWLASRYYNYSSSTKWYYYGRYIIASGALSKSNLYYCSSGFGANTRSYAVRPIVVLKSGISYTAARGTIDDPFILE